MVAVFSKKISASSLFPSTKRTCSSSCLFLLLLLQFLSKSSSLAKDFYYHPDKVVHYSTDSQLQHESNAMEYVTATRSDEVPIVTSTIASSINSSSTSSPDFTTTIASVEENEARASSSPLSSFTSTSRPREIVTEEKQAEKASKPFATRVTCNENEMMVDVLSSPSHVITEAYLQGLKNYPDPSCTPTNKDPNKGHHLQFRLSLSDLTFYRCGTNLIINKITGTRTYYNRLEVVVLEKDGGSADNTTDVFGRVTDDENFSFKSKTVLIKCQFANVTAFNHNNRIRRDVLPAGFQEAEILRYDGTVTKEAPIPMLTMRVRQDGRVIGEELLVSPGTPLTMEVEIEDQASREIYGILMSQMDVTDNAGQDEIIMLNGCSVDPYLFENFKTTDSDLLTAQFKAFKFPDSNYVLFRGTVNVCLESCEPTDCSNGQRGYGRRRRRDVSQEQGGVYKVEMSTRLYIHNPAFNEDNDMNPFILRGTKKSHSYNSYEHSDNIGMPLFSRRARGEPGVNQADFLASNKALSSTATSSSHSVLLFISFATMSILTTTLVLLRS